MKQAVIFLDNKFIPADDRLLKRLTPGILKARGVFETMRVYPTGKIFGLREHWSRLKGGLRILQIKSPVSEKQMKETLERILGLNHLTTARVRFMVWQDAHRKKVHTAMMAFPYDPFPEAQYLKGFKANISETKLNESSLMKAVKSLDYVYFLREYRRAKAQGYDEALLLNRRGELVEGSRSNIFFLKDGTLCTPALASGCLPGITRGAVIKVAGQMKIKVKQVRTTPQDFFDADEAFLTNSLIEVMPLTSIEGRLVGDGRAGRVTLRILREYRRLVSRFSVRMMEKY